MGLLDRFKKKNPATPAAAPSAPHAPTAQGELQREVGQQTYQEGRQTVAPAPKWQAGSQYSDKHVDSARSKDKAAGGAINQVDLLAYNDLQLGGGGKGFFKEALKDADAGDAASGIGITPEDSRLTERSVATSRVAEAAGMGNVIAKTAFATHNGKKGSVSELAPGRSLTENVDLKETRPEVLKDIMKSPGDYAGNEAGLDAEGKPAQYKRDADGGFSKRNGATEYRNVDLSNPRTQKELNDLQWVDALTGQVDRHGGNIFVDPASGAVKGIDNDAAFGSTKGSADPRKLTADGGSRADSVGGSHNQGMPTLVDAATAASIRAMDEGDLRKRLGPLLSPVEIENTVSRLQAVKQRLKLLELTGSVVGGGEDQQHAAWGAGTYDEEGKNDHSYLGVAIQGQAEAASGKTRSLKMETPEAAAAWQAKDAAKKAAEPGVAARAPAGNMGAHRARPAPAPAAADHYQAQAGALKPPPAPTTAPPTRKPPAGPAPKPPGATAARPPAPTTAPPKRKPPAGPAPKPPGAAAARPPAPTSAPPKRKPPAGPAPKPPGV